VFRSYRSLLALSTIFGDTVGGRYLLVFAGIGGASSLLLGIRPAPAIEAAPIIVSKSETEARRARTLAFLMYAGLPLLVLVVYLNVSRVLVERHSLPSILQPIILFLAASVIPFRAAFRPGATILRPLTILLISYWLIVFASSSWVRDAPTADLELGDLTKSLMLLIVVGSVAATWKSLRAALLALVAGAALLSLLTLTQVALGKPEMDFGGLAEVREGNVYGEVSEPRPAGPVSDPNYFARILVTALPAAALLGVARASRAERAACLAAAGLIAATIVVTYSRGGMMSMAAVAALLVAAGRVRLSWRNALVAVALVMAVLPTTAGKRLMTIQSVVGGEDAQAGADASVDKRRQLLGVGLRMFADHPLLGVGVGNFGSYYQTYANLVGMTGPDFTVMGVRQYPHNLYLEIAVETGLVGLGLFASAMAVAMVGLYRSRRELLARGELENAALVTSVGIGLAGYLLASVFLHHSGFSRYLWLVLGFAVAALKLSEQRLSGADPAQSAFDGWTGAPPVAD
jgi:putative inorganic carbon (HCO3(-)) transporter